MACNTLPYKIAAMREAHHIRWRLWHGQVRRALDLMSDTLTALDATAAASSPAAAAAGKVAGILRGLETYVAGQAALIIDYATARIRNMASGRGAGGASCILGLMRTGIQSSPRN